ncbi:Na+/H+ antiporter NhaC family protein [Marinospirillum sp.]|uniref:Na+/H+ antiporter NhaC family protein n=1 Tax=Marinospirillum sp. TaxID=2183934 RepID=UPI003A83BEC1
MIDYSHSWISLLPPLFALGLAILTRRVLLSLGLGILLGALLLFSFAPWGSLKYLGQGLLGLVVEDGGVNTWNMSIIAFLLLLGMMTALMTLSGGTRAFALWAEERVRGRRGAQFLAFFLGIFIFIDDYFNSLAVGSVARPITDRYRVSRAKLAYILDSTAAPMCVLTPASSWGAYIITLIGGILLSHGIVDYSPLGAFVAMLPFNFYALFALLLVFAVIWLQIDLGRMHWHEARLQAFEQDSSAKASPDEQIQEHEEGRALDLVLPIVTLIIATFASMVWTGAQTLQAEELAFSLLGAMENTDVGLSLCLGGLAGLAAALVGALRQKMSWPAIAHALKIGAKSMVGAILVLFFAWMLGGVIKDIQTGQFLASLTQAYLDPQYLPLILFLVSAVMAFSTGTSWGTFGIMLPIAGDMAAATEIALMLPILAAVLAGAVFGDHCSPISDTTILSSTGAWCEHIEHVTTQLPYALSGALIAAVGYLALGMTASLSLALLSASGAFLVTVCALYAWSQRLKKVYPKG